MPEEATRTLKSAHRVLAAAQTSGVMKSVPLLGSEAATVTEPSRALLSAIRMVPHLPLSTQVNSTPPVDPLIRAMPRAESTRALVITMSVLGVRPSTRSSRPSLLRSWSPVVVV